MASQKENLKKFEVQLEGLDILERIFVDILTDGLGSLNEASKASFQNYAQIMANHSLPKFQTTFEGLASDLILIGYHTEQSEKVVMQSSVNKIRIKLKEKLEASDGIIDSELRELTDKPLKHLRTKNNCKYDVDIFPLSFHCIYDTEVNSWFKRYFWINMENGSIYHTLEKLNKNPDNIIPTEPLFKKHHVPELFYASDNNYSLIRWYKKEVQPLEPEDYIKLVSFAETDIPIAVNKMKAYLKNTQAEKCYPVMLPVSRTGMVKDQFVIEDYQGNRIVLRQQDWIDSANRSICHLMDLPYDYQERQSIFGILFYESLDFSIYFHPHTLFAKDKIYRLID